MVLTLPWPPSINHYYTRTRFGGIAIAKAGAAYRRANRYPQATQARMDGQTARFRITTPLTGRLSVELYCHPPDKRVRDLDNILKCLLDALQHAGVYRSDGQIDRLLVVRDTNGAAGTVTVHITEYRPGK